MSKQQFLMRVAAYLVLVKDGQILLSRRFNTGHHDGEYSLVAGHLEGKETVRSAMVREAKEEANIDITESDLEVVHTLHRTCPNVEYIDFYLSAKKWQGEPVIMEKDKCDDLRWYPIDTLPENTIPYVRLVVKNIQNRVAFSEFQEGAE